MYIISFANLQKHKLGKEKRSEPFKNALCYKYAFSTQLNLQELGQHFLGLGFPGTWEGPNIRDPNVEPM